MLAIGVVIILPIRTLDYEDGSYFDQKNESGAFPDPLWGSTPAGDNRLAFSLKNMIPFIRELCVASVRK